VRLNYEAKAMTSMRPVVMRPRPHYSASVPKQVSYFASPGSSLFLAQAQRLAGKSIPKMTYFVSSGILSIDLVNQSIN